MDTDSQTARIPSAERAPRTLGREHAIDQFGATYCHAGGAEDPIVEVIGRHTPESLPSHAHMTFFRLEGDALLHVRTIARRRAELEVAAADEFDADRGNALRLWAATSLPFMRRTFGATLSLAQIRRGRRRAARVVLRDGFAPRVLRLPGSVRIPLVVPEGAPVFCVDYGRAFRKAPEIVERRVASRSALPASGRPFDVVLRYEIEGLAGVARFDTTDAAERRFGRYPDGIDVFLTREAAEAFLGTLCRSIEGVAGRIRVTLGEPPLVTAAPAAPRIAPPRKDAGQALAGSL